MSLRAAAEHAGMGYRTAFRRRADPAWQRRMMEAEAEAVKAVVRRGVRSAEAAMQVLTRIAGNVKGQDGQGAAERPEARTQVAAARALLTAFVGVHGRAMADTSEPDEPDVTAPFEYVVVGVDPGALR